MRTSTQTLVARAERLPDGTDLLDEYVPADGFFFARRGRGVVTRGSARTMVIPAGPKQVERAAVMATEALERVGVTEGPGPMVVGALPFDGMTPATLTIPCVAVFRTSDETAWRVTMGHGPGSTSTGERDSGSDGRRSARSLPARSPGGGASSRLDVSPVPERADYVAAVTEARRRIRRGELEKVVLARMLVVRADHDVDRHALLRRLRLAEPDAFVYAVHGFIGASPELLAARRGVAVTANPLAGTAARSPDPSADAAAAEGLLRSAKDLREHAPVVDAVREGLAPVCVSLDVDASPSAIRTGKVWHLSTEVRGTLRDPAPSVLELVARLHPTPAVCGTPRAAALAAIADLERIDRTLYAGAIGWMDAAGDGEWAVGLRCAEVQGRIALLFAGAGIVADSDPDQELAETDAKFRSMLDALGYA
jgi:isochorismate synthase